MEGKKLDLMWVTQTRWVSYDPQVGCLLLRSTPNAELLSRIPLAGATLACGKQEGVFMVRSSGREHLFKAASNEQMMIWLRNLQDKRSELIHTTGHTCYENNASGTSSQSTLVQEDILSDSGHQTPPEDNIGLLEGATMDSVQHLSTAETFTQPVLSSQGGEVVLPAEGVRENWISFEDNQPQECNFLAGYLLYLTGEQSTKKSNPLQKLSLRMSKRKLPGKSNMDMCTLDRYFKDGGSMTVKIDQETISPVSSDAGPGMFGRLLTGKEAEEPRSSRELQLKNISLQQDLDAQQELIKMLQQGIRRSQKEKISTNSPENPVTDLQCQEKLQKQQQQISDLTACLSISEQQKEQLVLEVSAQRKEVVNLKETVSALREMMQAKNSANTQLAKDLDQLKEQLQHHQQRELKLSKSKIYFLSDEVKAQENLRLESERRENELLNKYNDMLERYERLQQRLVVTLQWLGAADAAWEGPTLEFLAKACPLSCYDAHGFRVPLELEKQASGPSRAELLHELVGNIQNDPDEIEKVQQSKWTALFVSGELSPSMEVKHLVRSGVPPAYRPRLWRWFVNRHVGSERTAAPKEYYNSLLQEMAGQPNPAAHLVEMDLMRTLPGHQKFSSLDSPDICKLRRVLLAFSWRNPDIGYCQGFNRLAAISLLYLDEEEVFWCLLAIVEKIMPKDYYSKNLFASQADQRVLKDLLEDKLPRLHAHLLQQNVDLSLITINWFLVLFVDSLSTDILLRAWDSILFEGCKVIFRFALALFKYKEEEILKLHDSSSIFNYSSCFPRMILDFKKLSHIAFRELNPLRSRTLMQLRATHMAHLKEELREFERLQQNVLSRRESDKTLEAP